MEIITAFLLLVAVVVSLVIGLRSLRQTESIQKREARHALLKEIVEWATNVGGWRSEYRTAIKELLGKKDKRGQQEYLFIHITEVKEGLMGMVGKGQYISEVAGAFGDSLKDAVEMLRGVLDGYVGFLNEWQAAIADAMRKGMDDKVENMESAAEYENKIDLYVTAVMKEAAIVVTRDIR